MRLIDLRYIKTVTEEGNISKAAAKLFISQPSLSNAIRKIESTLGSTLFLRTKNGLVLTHLGQKYFVMATNILKIYTDFENEISDIDHLLKGKIHFGITNYVGSTLLPVILPEFETIAPNVEISFEENRSLELIELLKYGKLDFAVMHIDDSYKNDLAIDSAIINRSRFLLATKKNHPLKSYSYFNDENLYPSMDIQLFKNERFILSDYDQMSRSIAKNVFQKANIQPSKPIVTRNLITASRLVSAGLGVTFFPEMYIDLIANDCYNDFYIIDEKYNAHWDLVISTLHQDYIPKSVLLFIDLVQQHFSKKSL